MTDASQLIHYARAQFNDIAQEIERHLDDVATSVRDTFARKALQLPARRPPPPPTTCQRVAGWMSEHRAWTAAMLALAVTGGVGSWVYVRGPRRRRTRRARKASSGARTDVVVVAGAAANPLASALYLDLERRGFVVYVVAHTADDERYIRSPPRPDLIPLRLPPLDPATAHDHILRFRTLFARDHVAFAGAEPHRLRFRGLVLVPDTHARPARVEDLGRDEWSDALNAKLLPAIATTQLLLPAVIEHAANVLLLTPSVTPALRLPRHSVESTLYGALQGFGACLAAELAQHGLALSHLKLGDLDIPPVTAKRRREGAPPPRWRPTPLRQLHHAVFDELVSPRPRRVRHVGRGSRIYSIVGFLAPPAFIAWMMGGADRQPAFPHHTRHDHHLARSAGSLTWDKIDHDEA